jgi:hypothetical protein
MESQTDTGRTTGARIGHQPGTRKSAGKNGGHMRFSKTLLPLTTAQTEAAVRLYRKDFDNMTEQEQQLMLKACRDWQECIQEAGNTDPLSI